MTEKLFTGTLNHNKKKKKKNISARFNDASFGILALHVLSRTMLIWTSHMFYMSLLWAWLKVILFDRASHLYTNSFNTYTPIYIYTLYIPIYILYIFLYIYSTNSFNTYTPIYIYSIYSYIYTLYIPIYILYELV